MQILKRTRDILDKIIEKSYCMGQAHGEKKKIKDERRKELIKSVVLTENEKEKIDRFYKKYYGRTVSHDWHKLYQSYTGIFSEKYVPEILFSSKFEPLVNPRLYRYVLDDKILLPLFCQGISNVRTPRTIATYCNGVYFDAERNVMTKEGFIEFLKQCGRVIIKPTQDTSSGRGVRLVSFGDNGIRTKESINDILSFYDGSPFLIQEVIKPYGELKKIYSDAINTFRIVTYIWNGGVYHWPVTLRIGQGGSYLDNAHSGGMFIAVTDDGQLSDKAFTEFQAIYQEHPDTHVKFTECTFDFVPDLIRTAKKMHLNAPQLGVISWDLTIDEEKSFVLIEANTVGQSIWFPQMGSGKPAFGDNTEEILKYIGTK